MKFCFLDFSRAFSSQIVTIWDEKIHETRKKRNFKNLFQIYLLKGPFFHMRPNLPKSVEKWRSYKFFCVKFFRKKFFGAKIFCPGRRTRNFFLSQKLKKMCPTIILRPKRGKLGLKWDFGLFPKSKHAKNEIRLDPPPPPFNIPNIGR